MKRFCLTLGLAAIAALAVSCPYFVPAFKAKGTDGVQYTELTFTKKPTFIVFLKQGCPANPKGVPIVNELAAQLKDQVNVVGVINTDLAGARKEIETAKIKFPVIPDPNKVIIGGFKAERSFDLTMVATKKEAKWAKVWSGLDDTNVQEAIEIIRKHGHEVKPVQLRAFSPNANGPKKVTGCSF